MKSKNLGLIVIVVLLVIFGGCACSGYNGIVNEDENVKNKWANVQSSYQRRSDLIPNLVSTVKGAAEFEKSTLTQVTEARAKATSVNINADNLTPENLAAFQQAQSQVTGSLGRLLAVAEAYPTLQANANFRDLQTQLEGTENRINVARNDFNTSVNSYNLKVRRFPMNIFAGMFGFRAKPPFQADAGSQNAPKVTF
jgi:LemA protein